MVTILGVDGVTFQNLWDNYPLSDDALKELCYKDSLSNTKIYFGNYCAIRMSECLIRSGFEFEVIGSKCYSHRNDSAHKNRHFLLAEDMGNWLAKIPITGMGETEKLDDPTNPNKNPNKFENLLSGRTGMIFYKDYWHRSPSENPPTGDHIDLWDGFGSRSSIGYNCSEVWFWEVL